jgi:GGDEF domain-containing protein
VLGRFDECSFLFLLPHTGPDGAKVLAKRIGEQATERSIVDLVGDPVVISVGISTSPHPDVRRKDDLFSQARRAFLDAQKKGGGVVCTT